MTYWWWLSRAIFVRGTEATDRTYAACGSVSTPTLPLESTSLFHAVSSATNSHFGDVRWNQLVGSFAARWWTNRGSASSVPKKPNPPLYMSWLPFNDHDVTPCACCAAVTGQ